MQDKTRAIQENTAAGARVARPYVLAGPNKDSDNFTPAEADKGTYITDSKVPRKSAQEKHALRPDPCDPAVTYAIATRATT